MGRRAATARIEGESNGVVVRMNGKGKAKILLSLKSLVGLAKKYLKKIQP